MSDSDMFYCSFVSIHYIICECGKTFPSEDDLRSHLEKDHPQKKERTEYRCGICDAPFDTQDECVEHYSGAHTGIQEEHDYVEVYSQEEEEVQYAEDIELQDDNNISENVIVMTENVPEIHIPFDEEYEEDEVYEPVYMLPGPSDTNVARHKSDKKPRRILNKKKVVCEVCGKKYASNAALRYHQRVHTGEKPYQCTECPKRFTMPLFLQIHLRTHTGERPYSCPHCPKAFSNKAALLRHDRVHTGIKPYGCPQCGKFFTQSNSMKLHVNTVHLKMPAPYKSKSRKNRQREKDMYKAAVMRVIDHENEKAAESIRRAVDEPNVNVKPEIIFKEEMEEEIMLEDVGQEMVTYEVIYEE